MALPEPARSYPAELRRRGLDLVVGGRKVRDFANDLGIGDQAVCDWRWLKERVAPGIGPGLTAAERAELVDACASARVASNPVIERASASTLTVAVCFGTLHRQSSRQSLLTQRQVLRRDQFPVIHLLNASFGRRAETEGALVVR